MEIEELIRNEGKVEGKAELLLRLLRLRGFEVDGALEKRVLASSTPEVDEWFDRAVNATRLDEVFPTS